MANGSSMDRRLYNAGRRAAFEERNVDLSDDDIADEIESMELRGGVPSTAYEGACWSTHNCGIICEAKDNAIKGECTTWSRKCFCFH
jgi:hypothetical protein